MGTPDFAVGPLKKLVDSGYKISAVVTVADKPAGRGLKMHFSPVKQFAIDNNIPVLQPLKLKDPDFLQSLRSYNADLFIVVAFRKLPREVFEMPPFGCFNLHASLLPQYRGAAPINHAIINGEKKTGVTTFFLNEAIDEGKVICQKEISIGDNETAGELHDRLMFVGSDLVLETVEAIFKGTIQTKDQHDISQINTLKPAPKIYRNDCHVSWNNSASDIHNLIRGLSPYPSAYGILHTDSYQSDIKLLESSLTSEKTKFEPGTIIIKDYKLFVSAKDEMLEIIKIQPAGKKLMSVAEFLRGNRSDLLRLS